jgi:hypothetical protein
MEMRSTAQVVVLGRAPFGSRRGARHEVTPVDQDVAHMPVLPDTEFERQGASRLDALWPIAPGQAEQPQAAAVAVLGMAQALQQLRDEEASGRADASTPMDQPFGRPLFVRTMRGGHVFVQRGVAAPARAAGMARHALTTVQHLHQGVGDARASSFKLTSGCGTL